jgi:ATP-dependent Clp protease ATP-binding subunit ClpB
MEDIERIIDIQLGLIRKRLQERKAILELTEGAKEYIVRQGYSPVYGARPLKRVLQKQVLDALAMNLLEGSFVEGDRIVIDSDGVKIVLRKGEKR